MAKRFVRIESGKKIAGVCTGLAEYLNTDVTWSRLRAVGVGGRHRNRRVRHCLGGRARGRNATAGLNLDFERRARECSHA